MSEVTHSIKNAIKSNNIEIAKSIILIPKLDYAVLINQFILMATLETKDVNMVKLLLTLPNINFHNIINKYILTFAIRSNNIDILNIILKLPYLDIKNQFNNFIIDDVLKTNNIYIFARILSNPFFNYNSISNYHYRIICKLLLDSNILYLNINNNANYYLYKLISNIKNIHYELYLNIISKRDDKQMIFFILKLPNYISNIIKQYLFYIYL